MDIIALLTSTKLETLKYFNLSLRDLAKSYGIGKWNNKQILMHLSDAEGVLLERLKRTIAETNPFILAFNQDLWCQQLNYEHFPLIIGRAIFEANRNAIIYLAEHFYTVLGHKEYVHNERGIITLKDEFDKIVNHCQGHLNQIKQALLINNLC